jgi:hypothetical protein
MIGSSPCLIESKNGTLGPFGAPCVERTTGKE